jgi:hypothetical protein
MIPNIHIHEQLMFERCQQRQREMAGLRLAAGLPRERNRRPLRLAAIGGYLIKLGSGLKQLEARERQMAYDR